MKLDVHIVHSVEEVGEEEWNRQSQGRPFGSYRWYRFGEAVLAHDAPIYVIVSHEGQAIGRATFWLTRFEQLPVAYNWVRRIMEGLIRRWPLLMCRSPLSNTSGLIVPDGPLQQPVLETIAGVAQDLLVTYRGSFLVFDYLRSEEMERQGWPEHFARMSGLGPGTRMDLIWPDFDSYLAHLGKKRRYNLLRNYRLGTEQDIVVKQYSKVLNVDKVIELHENVNRRYNSPNEPWVREILEHAQMVDCVWLAAEKNGAIVGCELMLGDRDEWFISVLGMDYAEQYVYFMLGYEDIRCAIERGARVLRWGTDTYHAKRRVGFGLETNDNLMFYGRGRLTHNMGQWLERTEYSRVEARKQDAQHSE